MDALVLSSFLLSFKGFLVQYAKWPAVTACCQISIRQLSSKCSILHTQGNTARQNMAEHNPEDTTQCNATEHNPRSIMGYPRWCGPFACARMLFRRQRRSPPAAVGRRCCQRGVRCRRLGRLWLMPIRWENLSIPGGHFLVAVHGLGRSLDRMLRTYERILFACFLAHWRRR